MSDSRPDSLSFRSPPDPPDVAEPDGDALGIMTVRSAASIVLIVISCGRGTGVLSALSMAQFNAMVTAETVEDREGRTRAMAAIDALPHPRPARERREAQRA